MFRTDTHWTVNSDWRPMLTIEAFNGRAVTGNGLTSSLILPHQPTSAASCLSSRRALRLVVVAVAFSWRRIYTAGSDGSLRVWDLEFAFDPVSKAKAGIKGLSLVVSMVRSSSWWPVVLLTS